MQRILCLVTLFAPLFGWSVRTEKSFTDSGISAFGDFNGDKYNDMATVKQVETDWLITLHFYKKQTGDFENGVIYRLKRSDCSFVTGLIAADWDLDCNLDLIVKCKSNSTQGETHRAIVLLQMQDGFRFFLKTEVSSVELMVGDFSGDGMIDFIGYLQGSGRQLFLGGSSSNGVIPNTRIENLLDGIGRFNPLPLNHGSAFVDVDGDCISDLVFDAIDGNNRVLNFFVNDRSGLYKQHANTFVFPKYSGVASFGDFYGDGSISIAVPVCENPYDEDPQESDSATPYTVAISPTDVFVGSCPSGSRIYLYKNVQDKPVCTSSFTLDGGDDCRPQMNLCASKAKWSFELDSITPLHALRSKDLLGKIADDRAAAVKQLGEASLERIEFAAMSDQPIQLAVGEWNSDSYFDIATPVRVYKSVPTQTKTKSKSKVENDEAQTVAEREKETADKITQSTPLDHIEMFIGYSQPLKSLQSESTTDVGKVVAAASNVLQDENQRRGFFNQLLLDQNSSGIDGAKSQIKSNGGIHVLPFDYDDDGTSDIIFTTCTGAVESAKSSRSLSSSVSPLSERIKSIGSGTYLGGESGRAAALMNMFSPLSETVNEVDGESWRRRQLGDNDPVCQNLSLLNGNDRDAFFIKSTVLQQSEATQRTCYQQSALGAMQKILVTDIDGHKTIKAAVIKGVTVNNALMTPYVITGVGRTNNYIERFEIGLPLFRDEKGKEKKAHAGWISIIPNTQVFVFPTKLSESENWRIELMVSPASYIWWILAGSIVVMIVISVVILVLDRKEAKEDARDQHERFRVHFISA
eukprot:GDKJ01057408.1.p1 GENE.GDKJ01057408.1~~GDKJ01057408.1.p1  ORF type:complete len:806 (-),score=167.84 GDKJ01057408.1:169-2586(-)